jgi:hypothetical protein
LADTWYFGEAGEARGPFSLKELAGALRKLSDPRKILVWRHGFEDWKPIDDVPEISVELSQPPPLPKSSLPNVPRIGPPPLPRSTVSSVPRISQPSVSEAEASQFKNVRPDLVGIGGWLVLMALGQVLGPLRMLVSLGEHFEKLDKLDKNVLERFPAAIWGETAIYVGLLIFMVYTAVLFFRHSRKFPKFFIWECVLVVLLPFIDSIWAAFSIAAYTNRDFTEFMTVDPKNIGQSVGAAVVGGIWVIYVVRSKRVANTFVK